MIVAEEAVLTKTLALLPSPLIFGRIPKCFDTVVWTFLSSFPEHKIIYTCWPIQKLDFIGYLAASLLILGHY